MKHIFVSFIIFLFYFNGTSATFLECTTASDCVAPDSECIANICECPFGEVFSLDGSACLPIAVGMQAACEDDAQCGWLLGKHRCYRGKCNCEEGWRYHQGRCVKSAELFESCTTDIECFNGYDILAMKCKENKCECNEGYYLRGDYDCRPISETCEYCSLNSDCKTPGNICSGSFCIDPEVGKECPVGKKQSFYNSTSIRGYNTECSTNADCSSQHSICYPLTKTCACERGYFLKSDKNECVPELGLDSGCTKDDDCQIKPGRCIDRKCYCPKTHFTTVANNGCQKPMTHDNLFCTNNERCYVFGKEAVCELNTCICPAHTEMDENFICRVVGSGTEENCQTNPALCDSILNSECVGGKCQCPENYRLEENICLPNIDALCDNTKPCTVDNAECINAKCVCQENYVKADSFTCLKVSEGLDAACKINEQCSEVVKSSECYENKCKCIAEHVAINDICYQQKHMGETCTSSVQCHILLENNVQCRNSICQCPADLQPTVDRMGCESSGPLSSTCSFVNTLLLLTVSLFSFQLVTHI